MTFSHKETCPHCGQSIKGIIYGVYFTPSRYRVLNAIRLNPGITMDRLKIMLYPCSHNSKVISSTITMINSLLAATPYRIKTPGQGSHSGGYYVEEDTHWVKMWEKPFHRPELL